MLAVPKIYDSLPTVGQKWALVVGVSRFQPKIGAPPLRFAANDADAFAALLRDPRVGRFPPDNALISLTNDAATTGAIKTRLNLIAREARPEDVVVVYVLTHGSPRAADLKQVSYLYTYDTDARGADELFGTALPMVEVSQHHQHAMPRAANRRDFRYLSQRVRRRVACAVTRGYESPAGRGRALRAQFL